MTAVQCFCACFQAEDDLCQEDLRECSSWQLIDLHKRAETISKAGAQPWRTVTHELVREGPRLQTQHQVGEVD